MAAPIEIAVDSLERSGDVDEASVAQAYALRSIAASLIAIYEVLNEKKEGQK